MTNIAMVYMALIEIDGLPIKNGDVPWLSEITRGYMRGHKPRTEMNI